jgi:hypothetical protein
MGSYFTWWSKISGRSQALIVWQKLSFSPGYPKNIIFDNDPIFGTFLNFACHYTPNDSLVKLINSGIFPSAIARMGGTLKSAINTDIPEDWIDLRYAPQTAPVVYIFNYPPPGTKSIDKDNVLYLCTLGEIKDWELKSRNKEQFFVLTLLIGSLSILLVITELKREKT